MPSPVVELNSTSLGGWTSTLSGAVAVAAGETISIRLASPAGVGTWNLIVTGTDGTVSAPAITQASLVNGSATFTAPASPTTGWSLIFQSQIGIYTLGKDSNGQSQSSYTTGFKAYLKTVSSNQLIAINETTEGDPSYGWLKPINKVISFPGTSNPGPPEGVVTAGPGTYCADYINGEGYIKHTGTGNTGWKLITHA